MNATHVAENHPGIAWVCGSFVLSLAVVATLAGCGPSRPPKLMEEKVSLEQLRQECEGGNLKSCRYAHDRDETACRSRNDGKSCWRAAQDFEKGLGVVADREKAVWAVALACSNGIAQACTHTPQVGEGCWIGTPCNGRCMGRGEACSDATAPPSGN